MTTNKDTPTFDIVISYRRDDTQATSHAIYRELARRFGAERVLVDITSIPVGEDYDQFVRKIIARAKAVIVVIGPQWLTVEKHGVRRLDHEDDAVRGEIVAALAANVTLIPLLVDGATALETDALPVPLRPLTRLNMMPIHERYWDTDMATLAKRLSPLLGVETETASDKQRAQSSGKRSWIVATAILALVAIAAGWLYLSPAPQPSPVTSAQKTGMQPATAGNNRPAQESPQQKTIAVKIPPARRPLAITMIHESGKPRAYTAVYELGGKLYYGAGFNRDSLTRLLEQYAASPNARFATSVREYLPRLQANDDTLASEQRFKNLLVQTAGEDPVMTQLQDEMLQARYFEPARKECADIGITSALGYALIADTHHHSGRKSYELIKRATTQALDGTPVTGIHEHDWLRQFAQQRLMMFNEMKAPESVLNALRRRNETYIKLMEMNKWDLAAPVPVGRFVLVDP